MQSESDCRPLWPADSALALYQRLLDHFAFAVFSHGLERKPRLRAESSGPLEPGLIDREDVRLANYHSAFNYVLQFSNVSGPIVVHQDVESRSLNGCYTFGRLIRTSKQEVFREQPYVFPSFAKWWKVYGKHVKAIEEVLPEDTILDIPCEIAVGRRKHADINRNRFRASHALEFPFLKHS